MKASRDQFARAAIAIGATALLMTVVLIGAGPLQSGERRSIEALPPWAIEPLREPFVMAKPVDRTSPQAMLSAWTGHLAPRPSSDRLQVSAPESADEPDRP